ncbi:transcriptional regulator CdaR [Rhodococcus ruber BKS 20-38]|uniref:Transcriptional regulator CdaR n=1 Tax=Rhodococcus ruber BKS 20-38 TaxID=1278076 RepID=M2Y2G6_9NOCA|nr:PucR family transcriptional regulator [Rhodococcus ruber]EME67276.1 transcriptional regulator CdaR [Rhodococcus ruber BKS 20-38]
MRQAAQTVRDVLAFPEFQRGHPIVVAGHSGLGRDVTWVHVLESSAVSGLLSGGEVVLLTGVALPDSNDGLRLWVEELAGAQAAAVVIQLGQRWTKLPSALVHAADRVGLPLVALQTAVPFVDVTRSVLTSIVDSTHAELQESARIHEIFHRMALEGHSDKEIVVAVAWAARATVVLENSNHHVLTFSPVGDGDWDAALRDWERRSRRDGFGEGWLTVEVQARGQSWGRLVALVGPDVMPARRQRRALEAGAENLALRRVIEGDDAVFEVEARSELLRALTHGYYPQEAAARTHAESAGFPMTGRAVYGIAIQAPEVPTEALRLYVARRAASAGLDLLIGFASAGLLSLPPAKDPVEVLCLFARRLAQDIGPIVIGLAPPVDTLNAVRGTLRDAASAARAEVARGGDRTVVTLSDVRVGGLLAQLHQDPRLHAFVERELGPLLDDRYAVEMAALHAYLQEGRNKTAAAQTMRLSRPAFYARLKRARELVGADLEDAEVCLSLQLALLAHRTVRADSRSSGSLRPESSGGPRGAARFAGRG